MPFIRLWQRTVQRFIALYHRMVEEICWTSKKKKKKDANPLIITMFSNQEVIYLLLSTTHSLKVSEELAGTVGLAQTEGGSDQVLQNLPALFFGLTSSLLISPPPFRWVANSSAGLSAPNPLEVLSLAAVAPQTRFHHVNLASPWKDWPHAKLLFKGKKNTHAGGWTGLRWACVCTCTRISPARARKGNDLLHPAAVGQFHCVMKPGPFVQVISSEAACLVV